MSGKKEYLKHHWSFIISLQIPREHLSMNWLRIMICILCTISAFPNDVFAQKDSFNKMQYYNTSPISMRYYNKDVFAINMPDIFAKTFNGKILKATEYTTNPKENWKAQELKFDSNGNIIERVVEWKMGNGNLEFFRYANGNMVSYSKTGIITPDTIESVSYSYNNKGQLFEVFNSKRNTIDSIVYDDFGNKVEVYQIRIWANGARKERELKYRYIYDSNNNLIQKKQKIGMYSEVELYNQFGDIVKKYWDNSGKKSHLFIEYNAKRQVVKKTKYKEGKSTIIYTATYNDEGTLKKSDRFNEKGVKVEIKEFDSKGRIKIMKLDWTGKTNYTITTYSYKEDEKGNLIESWETWTGKNIKFKREYDTKGNLIKITKYQGNSSFVTYAAKFDNYNNPTLKVNYNQQGVAENTRSYSYVYLL